MEGKRQYHSRVREASAQRTKELIRDAATTLFVREGYVSATVKQIADAAGVANRTVFTAFPGGKLEIFEAALAAALDAEPFPLGAPSSASDPDDVRRIVSQIVAQGIGMLERAGALMMVTVESSGADSDMRRLSEESAEQSAANAMSIAEGLSEHGLLRPEISLEKAAGILAAFVSPQLHQQLRRVSGWDLDAYRSWLEFNIRQNLMY
ncbi:TetR/AcrR family transcriptional regulator [Rhodococcus baikonurensis]|uniref:TetR/AcrR family transcriptional regulator n=1 Tax=Rhodococcus baikonurensis TaxID=172041 RepID=UPI0037AF00D9